MFLFVNFSKEFKREIFFLQKSEGYRYLFGLGWSLDFLIGMILVFDEYVVEVYCQGQL